MVKLTEIESLLSSIVIILIMKFRHLFALFTGIYLAMTNFIYFPGAGIEPKYKPTPDMTETQIYIPDWSVDAWQYSNNGHSIIVLTDGTTAYSVVDRSYVGRVVCEENENGKCFLDKE